MARSAEFLLACWLFACYIVATSSLSPNVRSAGFCPTWQVPWKPHRTTTSKHIAVRKATGKAGFLRKPMDFSAKMYGQDERPKASLELSEIRCGNTDPGVLKAWIYTWPTGNLKNNNFGLPKMMLPVTWERMHGDDHSDMKVGLKLVFKGSLDPWLQIELDGDTVRVCRCTGLATISSLQVSALKEREESRICDKFKADLADFLAKSRPNPPPVNSTPNDIPLA